MAKKIQKKKTATKKLAKGKSVSPIKKSSQASSPKKKVKKVSGKKLIKPSAKIKKIVSKKSVPAKQLLKKVSKKPVAKTQPKKAISAKKKPTSTKESSKFIAHITSLKVGDLAPNFSGYDQHGQLINLKDLIGKKVILYFYPKDDTPGCTATACSLRDEYQFLGNKNYAVVGVSADDQKSHAKFAAKYELPFPLLADTEMSIIKAYDVWGTKMFMGRIYDGIIRTSFVINEKGIIDQVLKAVDTTNHAQQILSL